MSEAVPCPTGLRVKPQPCGQVITECPDCGRAFADASMTPAKNHGMVMPCDNCGEVDRHECVIDGVAYGPYPADLDNPTVEL